MLKSDHIEIEINMFGPYDILTDELKSDHIEIEIL